MNKTKIEWVKNPDGTQGYTWNPFTGCRNHDGKGNCLGGGFQCYAYKLANGRLKEKYLSNLYIPDLIGSKQHPYEEAGISQKLLDPFYPRFWPERLLKSAKGLSAFMRTSRKGIFVCDMSDLFGIGIPEEWTIRVMEQVRVYQRHRFYLLTKQPQNLQRFSPFPDNCWVGFTATSTKMFADSIIKSQGIKAAIRYVSFEPLLEWSWNSTYKEPLETVLKVEGINQVIIGAQTKPYVYPLKIWVDEITEACKKAGITYFLKDNLRPLMGDDLVQDMPRGVEIGHYSETKWDM